MADHLLRRTAAFVTRRWKAILWGTLGLSLLSLFFSVLLFQSVRFAWTDLVPGDHQVVKEYNKIQKDFEAATPLLVAVKGPNRSAIEQAISRIGPRLAQETNWFRTVFFQTEEQFLARYRLLLTRANDLKNTARFLTDFNLAPYLKGINDTLESEYLGDQSGLKKQEKNASQFLEGLHDFLALLKTFGIGNQDRKLLEHTVRFFTTGPRYMIAPDGGMGLITIFPRIPINDLDNTIVMVEELEKLLTRLEKQYPGIKLEQTGMHTVTRDEMRTVEQDSMLVTVLAMVAVVLMLIRAFRMRSAPLIGLTTLLVGVLLTLGLTYVFIGYLNLFTAMCAAILMGLGIDYSIHILAQYTEARSEGREVEDAIRQGMENCGRGLFIGAATTALAFFILILVPFDALSQLGVVTAIGVACTFLASFLVLPSLILFKEYKLTSPEKRAALLEKTMSAQRSMRFDFLARIEQVVNKRPLLTVLLVLLITAGMVWAATGMKFSGDLKEIEAKGLKSLLLNDEILERFDMTYDSILITSTNLKQDRRFYRIMDRNPMVSMVDAIAFYVPSPQQQARRLGLIKDIRTRLQGFRPRATVDRGRLDQQLERLGKNLLELRDMAHLGGLARLEKRCARFLGKRDKENPGAITGGILPETRRAVSRPDVDRGLARLQQGFASGMRLGIQGMLDPGRVTIADLPHSIRQRLLSRDGSRYLLAAYLIQNNWDNIAENRFLESLHRISNNKATGAILFMQVLVKTAIRDGSLATILALATILLLILVDFRNLKATLYAFLNLVVSATWMIGMMALLGQKFNFMNVLTLPLIIGIGIDDSVHILHRYKQLGPGSHHSVLASTGRGVLLTSLTTMCGFGSLMFSTFQGMQSFGLFLFFGVGFALILSVLFLPALMRLTPRIFRENGTPTAQGGNK